MCCTLRMLSHYLLHHDSTGKEEANAVRFTECLIIFYSVQNGSQQELLEDDLIELMLLKIILKTVKRMGQRLVQVERGPLQWPKVRTQAVGMGKRSQTSSIWNPFFYFYISCKGSNVTLSERFILTTLLNSCLTSTLFSLYTMPIYFFFSFSQCLFFLYICSFSGFPGGSGGKKPACSAEDLGLIPGQGRFPGEGNGNPLQYSCMENSINRGA